MGEIGPTPEGPGEQPRRRILFPGRHEHLVFRRGSQPGLPRERRLRRQMCILLAVGCLAISVAAGLVAWQVRALLDAGTPTPVPVPVADLAGWKSGDNLHVTVTEFGFGESYVVEKEKGYWKRLWIPLLPPEGRSGIKVVATTARIRDQEQLDRFIQRKALTGIIANDVPFLASEQPKKLRESYPGVDFSRVLILEVDRKFTTAEHFQAVVGSLVGLLLTAALGFLAYLYYRRRAEPGLFVMGLLVSLALVATTGLVVSVVLVASPG
jgi:hypothetical protein